MGGEPRCGCSSRTRLGPIGFHHKMLGSQLSVRTEHRRELGSSVSPYYSDLGLYLCLFFSPGNTNSIAPLLSQSCCEKEGVHEYTAFGRVCGTEQVLFIVIVVVEMSLVSWDLCFVVYVCAHYLYRHVHLHVCYRWQLSMYFHCGFCLKMFENHSSRSVLLFDRWGN